MTALGSACAQCSVAGGPAMTPSGRDYLGVGLTCRRKAFFGLPRQAILLGYLLNHGGGADRAGTRPTNLPFIPHLEDWLACFLFST